jgi:hypothetical protein
VCATAPRLLSVDDEYITIAIRAGQQARQIRSSAGLGEELEPQFPAGEDVRNVREFLLVSAKSDERCTNDVDRHTEVDLRHVVPARLGVEHSLVLQGKTLAAVLDREREAGVTCFVKFLLKGFELVQAFYPFVDVFLGRHGFPTLYVLG